MNNWIRTDIDIGYRVKCFDFDYNDIRRIFSIDVSHLSHLWTIEGLEGVFVWLKEKGYLPKTGALVRVNMPSEKMAICFWVQDSNFKTHLPSEMVESEYVSLREDKK